METQAITERCSQHFEARQHVCFGVSPFNSYFSEERIRELASWGRREFRAMHFFIPDGPSAYTLEALGYSSEDAAWKARRQGQYVYNKTHRALTTLGYSVSEASDMILSWRNLPENPNYVGLANQVSELFAVDLEFQQACLEASRWVLEKRVPDTKLLTLDTLQIAVKYLLAEIPLFLDTAGIVGQGASVFCYHQCPEFIENLFKGIFPIQASDRQGFVLAQPFQVMSHLRQNQDPVVAVSV